MEDDHLIMSPSEVATLLDIKESTLRKYALLLNKAGYHFQVNENGQRWYYNRDVIALRKMIQIKQSPDMTLEQAAGAVVSWVKQSGVTLPITLEKQNTEQHNADMKELKEMIQVLVQKLDQQQRYIEDRIEKRDREWLEFIRESQEQKKQLLELAAAQEEEHKKSFWHRLFGK